MAVIGIAFFGLFAASVVATGGASLAVVAAVAVGAVVVSAGVGAAAGHYGAKHMGVSTAIGVAGGTMMGGIPGAVIGGGVAVGLNGVVKDTVGMSVDEALGNGAIKVGEGLNKVGKAMGVSEEQEQLLAAHQKAQEAYTAPTRKAPEVVITEDRRQNWLKEQTLAHSQSQAVSLQPHEQSVEKDKHKRVVVSEELQKKAHRVGEGIDPALITEKHSQRQTPAKEGRKSGKSGREVGS